MDTFDLYLKAVEELAAKDHEVTNLEKEIVKLNPDYTIWRFLGGGYHERNSKRVNC